MELDRADPTSDERGKHLIIGLELALSTNPAPSI
jgi:hypothetical protein